MLPARTREELEHLREKIRKCEELLGELEVVAIKMRELIGSLKIRRETSEMNQKPVNISLPLTT